MFFSFIYSKTNENESKTAILFNHVASKIILTIEIFQEGKLLIVSSRLCGRIVLSLRVDRSEYVL